MRRFIWFDKQVTKSVDKPGGLIETVELVRCLACLRYVAPKPIKIANNLVCTPKFYWLITNGQLPFQVADCLNFKHFLVKSETEAAHSNLIF